MNTNVTTTRPRGYFAMGAERISKPGNLGNLVRSAHAFGASFFFTVDAHKRIRNAHSDTSDAGSNIPYYGWSGIADMQMPSGCELVGVELMEDAIDLPSFYHPRRAAYVLGPEAGSLSPEMREQCTSFIRIPSAFCINVAMAGAIVMYDRVKTLGNFPARPVSSMGMPEGAAPPIGSYAEKRTSPRGRGSTANNSPSRLSPNRPSTERAARVRAPRSAAKERP
ncbi:MAG: RNA methyltransferase [Candidatus Phaeomarinobacter sp.]